MKKTLFSTMLVALALQFNAQTTIFEETFDSTAQSSLPTDWSTVDSDVNDFFKWAVWDGINAQTGQSITNPMGFSGSVATVPSNSGTSDHLLSTPEINLNPGGSYSLTFLIGTVKSGILFESNNYYAVYVLPASSVFTPSATPVIEESITQGDTAISKTINLSNFAGQNIKIYFRQFNTTPGYRGLLLDNVRVTQQSQLGTSEIKQAANVAIYPNPTSDYVYLKSKSKITKAEVFDTAGRKLDAAFSDNRLDIKNLQPGTYMVRFTEGNKISSQKIIKK
jgi:hypothetical protein